MLWKVADYSFKGVNNSTYWISHVLPCGCDDGECQEEGGGSRVVETEDAGVNSDTVWLDEALEPPKDIQHNAWMRQNLSWVPSPHFIFWKSFVLM